MTAEALTYDSLVTDIQTYAERSDQPFVDQIPRFIMLAENRIASEIHGLGFVRVVDSSLTSSDNILAKPERWRETKSIFLKTSGEFLYPRTAEYCQAFAAQAAHNIPRYYADYDYEHFILAPIPSTSLTFTLRYHERPEPLSSANQSNWTTQYAPQLLLYASLLEAQPFLKLPERIQEFQALFDRAASALSNEDSRRMEDSASNGSKK